MWKKSRRQGSGERAKKKLLSVKTLNLIAT